MNELLVEAGVEVTKDVAKKAIPEGVKIGAGVTGGFVGGFTLRGLISKLPFRVVNIHKNTVTPIPVEEPVKEETKEVEESK